MLRIVASPGVAWLISTGQYQAAFYSLGFAGALDWADGLIARKFKGQASLLGSFLDPLADKVLVACTGLSMAFAGVLHPALIFVVVGRDVLLVAGSLIYRYKNRAPGERFFSLQRVSFKVEPSLISKVNTTLQIGLVVTAIASAAWPSFSLFALDTAALAPAVVDWIPSSWWPAASTTGAASGAASASGGILPVTLKPVVDSLSWVVGGTTIWTGLDYLFRGGFGKLKASAIAANASRRAGELRAQGERLMAQAQGKAKELRTGKPSSPSSGDSSNKGGDGDGL